MPARKMAARIVRASASGDWGDANAQVFRSMQDFARQGDWDALEAFYDQVLHLSASRAEYEHVRIQDLTEFTYSLAVTLQQAVQQARENMLTVALYFEYLFDGGDCYSGDFFLCRRYNRNNDIWAADFVEMMRIPCVFRYFNYDTEVDFKPLTRYLADFYVNAHLLACLGRLVDELPLNRLPVGFAAHGQPIVHI